MTNKRLAFSSRIDALSLPAPERGKPFLEYPNLTLPQFKVRVHPPDAAGRVRRQYAIRVKYTGPDKTGKVRQLEDRSTLGLVEALDKTERALDYKEAYRRALTRIQEVERIRTDPGALQDAVATATRMTVNDAWVKRSADSRTRRDATAAKEKGVYARYLQPLADRFLDELDYSFWSDYIMQLAKGKRVDKDNPSKLVSGKPLREATLIGIANVAASLYETAHKHKGLPGQTKDWNPAREAKAVTLAPDKRKHHIPLAKLAEVWAAADQLCAPWARDQLRLYLLTGLRKSLVSELLFKEVDFERGLLKISPHKTGTKRRKKDTPLNAPDIVLPLPRTAIDMLKRRQAFAPDPEGFVWYAAAPARGKAAGTGAQRHGDPRSNWQHVIDKVLGGTRFTPHDCRRTFATTSMVASAPLIAVSLLMLHSPRTVARTLSLPDITVDYINTSAAQQRMRKASDAIEKYILGVVDGTVEAPTDEPTLSPELEDALGGPDTGDE